MERTGRLICTGAALAAVFAACSGGDDTGPGSSGQAAAGPTGCDAAISAQDPSTVEGDTRESQNLSEGSCITGAAPEVRFDVTVATTGMLDLTLASDEDLGLYVRTECEDESTEIGCADSGVAGEAEALSVPVTAGQRVWVFVDGYDADQAGRFTLTLQSRAIVCGDDKVEGGEECDPPDQVTCSADCARVPEICDDGADNDVDMLTDCEDAVDCGSDAACPLAMICGQATPAQASENGDSSTGGGYFAGSCTGGGLAPEALFTYSPSSTGALLLALQSATDQGVYVRSECADPASEIGCLDDNVAGIDEVLVIPVEGGVPLTVFVDAAGPMEAGPFTLDTTLEPSTEVEPNDTTGAASDYGPQVFVGAVSPEADVDYIAVDLQQPGATLTAEITDFGNGDCANFKLDSVLEVFGPDGTTSLAMNDDTGNFCSRVEATGLSAGIHYVRVSAAEDAASPTFAYRLSVQTN
jgi:hypothetical protein